jgi:hypothetical protein
VSSPAKPPRITDARIAAAVLANYILDARGKVSAATTAGPRGTT